MTVEYMLENISSAELAEWQAFFMVENQEYEHETEKHKKNTEAQARAKKQGR